MHCMREKCQILSTNLEMRVVSILGNRRRHGSGAEARNLVKKRDQSQLH